jgi:hypothetical protein
MIGRSGLRSMLRNMKISPWTRRSLTERFLLDRGAATGAPGKPKTTSSKALMLSIAASLRRTRRRRS